MKWNFIEPEINEINRKEYQPASYIRKSIMINRPVRQATLFMTALGVYDGYFNGKRLDEQLLRPGFTNYRARLQYQTHDVTDQVRAGENVIGAVVGDGWYRGTLGPDEDRNFYGEYLKLAAVLQITYEDGEEEYLTDSSWRATQDGPIRNNDLKVWEIVDMRREMQGWNDVGFDDSTWHNCKESSYDGILIPQEGAPLIEQEEMAPKIIKTPNGEQILDFGQNHTGHVKFTVSGAAGTTVELHMGECIDEAGNFTLSNLQSAGSKKKIEIQQVKYTLKEGTQTYKSRFLICGYRYVKLVNWPEKLKTENFTSIAIYSDFDKTGNFSCSNEEINKLFSNVCWSMKSNFAEIPTDCPQRERAGWTGDINVFAETANYLGKVDDFLVKWLHDFVTLQLSDGNLPYVVPPIPMGTVSNGSAGWSDAIAGVPMELYRFYGDKKILEQVYDTIKAFVEFNRKRAKKKHIRHCLKSGSHYQYILDTGYHFGEWMEPGKSLLKEGLLGLMAPDEEVATAWWYYSTWQLTQMAEVLGKDKDAKEYKKLAEQIKEAYNQEFLSDGIKNSDRQCKYVRPLYMELVEGKKAQEIASKLNKMCIAKDYVIGTGFLTTYKLLPTLCDYGYVDTAYKILENPKCPGWLYEVNSGATTIWENWIGIDEKSAPVNSHNHYAAGSVVAWLFAYCGGIRPVTPGFEKIQIKPIPGGSLTWANTSYESIKGRLVSNWKLENGHFYLHVEVPEGVETEVVLPDGSIEVIWGGIKEYHLTNWQGIYSSVH